MIPVPRAAWLLPVADLHLAVGAKALGRHLDGRGGAARVDAHAVAVTDRDVAVNVARAVVVVARLEPEGGLHAHARMGPGPEAPTVTAGPAVPLQKVGHGDAGLAGNDDARVAGLDVLEPFAVALHARLRESRRLDAVGGRRGRGPMLVSYDASAQRRPQSLPALGLVQEVGQRDVVLLRNTVAVVALRDKVELAAVVNHTGLSRTGRFDS